LFWTEFAAAQPAVEMYAENQRRDNNSNETWVQFGFIPGQLRRADIGSGKNFRQSGVINVQIMIPESAGTRTGLQIADSVTKILTDRVIALGGGGQVVLYGVDVASRGVVNGWLSYSVKAMFRADYQIIR
jgi:hypothetical protein